MRWFAVVTLGVMGVLGAGVLHELSAARPPPAASDLALPTHFEPPSDLRSDAAVLRLAFSAGLQSADVATPEFAQEARFANAWRDEIALGSQLAPVARVALPEPSFAALAASAALLAAVARRRTCRWSARRAVAARPLLPR